MTTTAAEANPSHHFDRRVKINGGVGSISSLPDEILHQILSLIPTESAIRTSVLSKRFKHVWRETPSLYFHRLTSPSESIRKTLASYSATKITSFRLRTRVSSKKRAQLVNSLIEFAMSHNVDELSLEMGNQQKENYKFPDFVFSNSSLKQLIIDTGYYRMMPRCTVSWTSLKSLSLTCVDLSSELFSKMLSRSPMLESLTLKSIFSLEYLDLSKSLRLRRLEIFFVAREQWQIVAPHIYSLRLRNLKFIDNQAQSNCTLVDVSSLTEANIDFNNWWYKMNRLVVQTMLEKLQNVENLTLGVNFLQMLSMTEFCGVHFPTFKVKTLSLETRISRSLVPGIGKLIQNSPGLKKITVYAIECSTEADKCINIHLESQELNPDQCSRLKDVVSPASLECEVAELKLVALFVELLLANTRTLETMVLRLGNYFDRLRFGELSQITHTLSHKNKVSIVIK